MPKNGGFSLASVLRLRAPFNWCRRSTRD